MNDLLKLSVSALSGLLRKGELSCLEVIDETLRRVDEVNPRLNAIIDRLDEAARLEARRLDERRRGGTDDLGALFGVPVTVKINTDLAGYATNNGVPAFVDRVAAFDNPCIANLRRAGAICIGRTNVPAFSARYFTDNDLYGRTINPWREDLTPGGSSGGAAVAAATRMGLLAHGNDRAGSIRFPAHANGIVGIRPTIGRVPNHDSSSPVEPTLGSELTNVQGCLGRSVADVRAGFWAMAAPSDFDPIHVAMPSGLQALPSKIALVSAWPDHDVDKSQIEALRAAADALERAGHRVEETRPPHLEEAGRLFWTLIGSEDSGDLQALVERFGGEAIVNARRSTLAYAPRVSSLRDYLALHQRRSSILRDVRSYLRDWPVTIMPVTLGSIPTVNTDQRGDAAVATMLRAFTPLTAISFLGLPSLAVPTGIKNNIPQGIQIVGRPFAEETCFAVGTLIERDLPCAQPPL